jgi:hypothetical protein
MNWLVTNNIHYNIASQWRTVNKCNVSQWRTVNKCNASQCNTVHKCNASQCKTVHKCNVAVSAIALICSLDRYFNIRRYSFYFVVSRFILLLVVEEKSFLVLIVVEVPCMLFGKVEILGTKNTRKFTNFTSKNSLRHQKS